MRFVIDPSLQQVTPHISVAVVRITLSSHAKANLSSIAQLKENALSNLLSRCSSNTELEAIDTIKDWLKMYKAMGLKPKKIKPTHYALAVRLIKEKYWPRSIGPLVDVYLANQIKHLMPHGGFDVAALSKDTIKLLAAEEEYKFQKLGVRADDIDNYETTSRGEILYLDCSAENPMVLTRYFNHRDAEPTKIVDNEADESKSSRDIILFIEGLDASQEGRHQLEWTAKDLEEAYRFVYGSGLIKSFVRIVESDEKKEASLSLDF